LGWQSGQLEGSRPSPSTMRKDREFSSLIGATEMARDIPVTNTDKFIRTALFAGKLQWAIENGIEITEIEDLNRAGNLRVKNCIQDPSLTPFQDTLNTEDFESTDLLKLLLPQNVKDRCFTGVHRHHWDPQQVRETIIRHFVNADFIKRGLSVVTTEYINGESVQNIVNKTIVKESITSVKKDELFNLGTVVTRHDIPSTLGPFEFASNCETVYPPNVIETLNQLVEEHARVFSQFIPANTENNNLAYRHCPIIAGKFVEPFFQVDIAGLSQDVLGNTNTESAENLMEILRGRIFEFEPSIAMYGLIETFGGAGTLGIKFREHLNVLRKIHNRPVVLLAPTFEKFEAMREEEFGKTANEPLTTGEVNTVSGFDGLWGPNEFLNHLKENGNSCKCLLYVRPSDPISKLIDPKQKVPNPLLDDPSIRRVIRNNAITLNIDNPDWPINDPRRIKDSKAALPLMDMGFEVNSINDLISDQGFLTNKFNCFITLHNLSPVSFFRAKPMRGVYGGYGQRVIRPSNKMGVNWLKNSLDLRGPYIIQPEIEPLIIKDRTSEQPFAVMDRAFFSTVRGFSEFIGGIRILIPTDSNEAKRKRLHGTDAMISAPIICKQYVK